MSYHPDNFGGHSHSGRGVMISCDLARPRDQRVMSFYGWEPLMVSHHASKFGGLGIEVVEI